jgi:hypothetical protein
MAVSSSTRQDCRRIEPINPTNEKAARSNLRRLRYGRRPVASSFLALPGLASLFSAWDLLLRLGRDDQTFRTLPVIRPECTAINGDTGLLHSLEDDLGRLASNAARRSACRS